jgi:hypothetical protein
LDTRQVNRSIKTQRDELLVPGGGLYHRKSIWRDAFKQMLRPLASQPCACAHVVSRDRCDDFVISMNACWF